jgi:septum formation protein
MFILVYAPSTQEESPLLSIRCRQIVFLLLYSWAVFKLQEGVCMNIILGSQSPWRRDLMNQLGYDFGVMSADIDEKAIRSDNYRQLPLLIARAKSDVLLKRIQADAILITVDEIVVWNGELREKPETVEQAVEFVRSYGEAPAQTITAVVAHNTVSGRRYEDVDICRVYYREIPDDVIRRFVQVGDAMSASGALCIEEPLLAPYVERIEGTKESVIGLPLEMTRRLIERSLSDI